MDVLAQVMSCPFFTDMNLRCLVLGRMANLSLEHGNCDASCYAYVWLGMTLGPHFGDYGAGFRFGKLSVDLVEKRGLDRFKARVEVSFGYRVIPWTRHLRTGRTLVRHAIDAAQEVGDLTFASYSHNCLISHLLVSGDSLSDVQQEAEHALEFVGKVRFGLMVYAITGQLGLIRTLRGLTPQFGGFSGDRVNEDRFEQHLEADPGVAIATCFYWINKLQALFYAADYISAIAAASKASRLLWTLQSCFEIADYHFFAALARAARCDTASADERIQLHDAIVAHHKPLAQWAENCPENFADRAALVAAEIARLNGRDLDAMRLYEGAIRLAHEHGFVQNEGLANELAARFYAARGFDTIAHAYLRSARYCYLRWGADGKVRQIEQSHPHLREAGAALGPTATIAASVERLDLGTVVKMSQAISEPIVLEKLIDTLLVMAVEHAGAERGLLILPSGDGHRVAAAATTGRDGIAVRFIGEPPTPSALPASILKYVLRTQDTVILDDASVDNLFSADDYLAAHHVRSVLCLPLVKQGGLTGVLYLENNLASHVFTPARLEVLKLLASQAAISVDNARLYAEVQESEDRLRLAIDTIPAMVASALPDGSTDFLNERWQEYTGLTLDDTPGDRWAAIHPDDRPRLTEAWGAAVATGEPFEHEARTRRADGQYRWFLYRELPLRDSQGAIVKWYGAAHDIDDLRRAEEKVRQDEGKIRRLVDSNIIGICIWNLEGRIIEANDAFLHMVEYGRDDLVSGRVRWTELTPAEWRDADERAVAELRATGTAQPFEKEYFRKDGSRVPVLLGCAMFEGRRDEGVAFVLDLTERKRAEAQLQEVAGRLITAQEEERRRVGRELHDHISQQLALLAITIDQILAGGPLPPAFAASLLDIRQQTDDVTNEVHGLSHRLHSTLIDQLGLVPAVERLTAEWSSRSGIRADFTRRVLSSPVSSDVALCLFRVAEESLANIAKHSGAGTARVEVADDGSAITLSIEDDGVGFQPETVETKAGLGFISMRERLRIVGGTIRVRSGPSRGTRVDASVPAVPRARESSAKHEQYEPTDESQREL
jgi:PAS domain S-box-containing protein